MKSVVTKKRAERKTARHKGKEPVAKAVLPAPKPAEAEEEDDNWLFDRHDLRHGQPLLPKDQDFKAHLMSLGDISLDRSRALNHKPSKQA